MPSYDLQCDSCEHTFETFRPGFLRDEDRVCPQCGATHATQLMTGGFIAVTSRRGGDSQPVAAAASRPSCGGHCGCGGH
jgi:putative FmdB family regulatory protein